jgi:hypothetical protein
MNSCLTCGKGVKNKYCNVSCQNIDQNRLKSEKRYGSFKKFNVQCVTCDNIFTVNEREKLHPKKQKYYCSRSCANKRIITGLHKRKTSKSLNDFWNTHVKVKTKIVPLKKGNIKKENLVLGTCEYCGNSFKKKKQKQRFCGNSCSTKFRMPLRGYSSKGGLASVLSQNRRSKNEIYFHDLCKNYFENVLANKPVFNGWDADIIIEDCKIAVLWNGVWHYKKISEKHSVLQVQNRDNLKIKEIIFCGYEPYVIKDLGKYNPEFVMNEFEKLKTHIAG